MGLGETQHNILHWLLRLYVLKGEQVCRLFYSDGSYKYAHTKMRHLTELGYTKRRTLPVEGNGQKPYLYFVAENGRRYLSSTGVTVPRSLRDRNNGTHLSFMFLDHTLAVNDVIIAAELLSRKLGTVNLRRFRHERELKREAARLTYKGEKLYVASDAWLDFRYPNGAQDAVLVEVDRGTEHIENWKRKVRGLIALWEGPYEEMFNTKNLIIAVTAPDEERSQHLRRWTEQELERLDRKDLSPMFFFTATSPVESYEYFFHGEHWRKPFAPLATALLEINE